MGRLRKYNTKQEQVEAQRAWSRKYYDQNKDTLNKKTMEKYHELRKNIQPDSAERED